MAYVRPVSKTTWFLAKRSYTEHLIQELTSIFVAILAFILMWGIGAVAGGPEAYQGFLDGISSPLMVLLLWITLIVMVYHAYSWFKLTPKAMQIQTGEDFVPGNMIAGAHYGIWVLLSLVVLWLAGVF